MAAMSPQSARNRAAICAVVLGADRALTAPEISAQVTTLGHDSGQTSQHLFRLRTAGVLERVDGGKGRSQCYDVGDMDEAKRIAAELTSQPAAPAGADEATTTPTAAPAPVRKAGRGQSGRARRKNSGKGASPAAIRATTPAAGNGAPPHEPDGAEPPLFDYAVSTKGDIQIVRADGEGVPAVLPLREALRLAAFIEMARPIMDRAKELATA